MIEIPPHMRRALSDARTDELRHAAEADRLAAVGRAQRTGRVVGHRMATLLVRVVGTPGHHYVRPSRSHERRC